MPDGVFASCPVRAHARARPDDPALRGDAVAWTWRDYDAAVGARAAALDAAGVGPGGRIAALAAPSPDLAALVFAALRRGALLAPLNLRRGADHWRRCLRRLAPVRLWSDAAHDDFAAAAGCATLSSGPRYPAAAAAALDPARGAVAVFTSGSRGAPRGVVLTAGNLLAGAAAANANLPLGPRDVWLADLPLYHVGGLAVLFRCALAGCAVRVRARFDPRATLDELAAGDVTILSCVPGMLRELLAADPGARALARARAILLGGAAADPELLARAGRLGLPVLPTYGMTEAGSQICTAAPGEAVDPARPAARPLPGLEVRVTDDAGREAPAGVAGGIRIRGPAVFACYLDGGPGAPDAAGWFDTGDVGRLDAAGRLEVLGRRDDVFVSGGENIHPLEIEAAARGFPGLEDCAAVGVPSRRWGRRPVLFATPAALDAAALRAWLAERLPRLLVPDAVIPVAELPRLALGKVDRRALLARHLAAGGPQPASGDSPSR